MRLTFGKTFFQSGEYSILNRKTMLERNYPFESVEKLLKEINHLRSELYQNLQ